LFAHLKGKNAAVTTILESQFSNAISRRLQFTEDRLSENNSNLYGAMKFYINIIGKNGLNKGLTARILYEI
jgi:hypothetical protein